MLTWLEITLKAVKFSAWLVIILIDSPQLVGNGCASCKILTFSVLLMWKTPVQEVDWKPNRAHFKPLFHVNLIFPACVVCGPVELTSHHTKLQLQLYSRNLLSGHGKLLTMKYLSSARIQIKFWCPKQHSNYTWAVSLHDLRPFLLYHLVGLCPRNAP